MKMLLKKWWLKKDSTNSATNEIRATTHGIMKDEFVPLKAL